MKRLCLNPLLIGLAALLLIAGLVALPVVREMRQAAKDRALIAAVRQEDESAVVRLLDAGADPNARELPDDTRPFWRICWDTLRGRKQEMSTAFTALLIAVGDIPPVPPGKVPRAVRPDPDVGIMRALLEHGANPNIPDEQNNYPLSITFDDSDTAADLLLIRHGGKLDKKDDGKLDPFLLKASQGGEVRDVQDWLDMGVNVNAQEVDGTTALIHAVDWQKSDSVKLLLSRHASVGIKDHEGHTALYYAEIKKKSPKEEHIVRLLRQAGAR